MTFTSELDWQIIIVIVAFLLSFFSKYTGSFECRQLKISYWSMPLSFLLLFCWIAGFMSTIAVSFAATLIVISLGAIGLNSALVRYIAGTLSVVMFLALGFHVVPGFENILYVDSQLLKGNSTTYTSYINFDKSIGGLVFFLILVPSYKKLTFRKFAIVTSITLVTSTIVLLGGKVTGLINLNFEYLFDYKFAITFIFIQLFSTTLAEETFFRGFIQQRMYLLFKENSIYQKTIPLIITSILFGLVHFAGGLGYMVAATFAGVGYGLIYQLTHRVEASMIAHTTLNIFHLIFFTYPFSSTL